MIEKLPEPVEGEMVPMKEVVWIINELVEEVNRLTEEQKYV